MRTFVSMQQPVDIADVLRRYWGYSEFRSVQERIIRAVLDGRDTLALMPTGGGKSLTYQVPTMAREGLCIVVTPLIALMKDQVDRLRSLRIPAVAIHSGLSPRQLDIALDNCVYGDVKFLYVAPERLASEAFRLRVVRMNVSLIAVDEAHCISQWGYDFRPSYLRIAELREKLPGVPVLALTASATERVAEDIQFHLKFAEQHVVRGDFRRPNLSYSVRHTDDKNEQLMRLLQHVAGSGIVYMRTREGTEQLAATLCDAGISAAAYHGGLGHAERAARQEDWLRGKVRVMVATNAFGMGIDKPDVRYVIHYSMPSSLENYYQEAGRAGRDGQSAECILFYKAADERVLQFLLENQDFGDIGETQRKERIAKDWRRLEAMKGYALTQACLRHTILTYFGEDSPEQCGACSNCMHEYELIEISESVHTILGAIKSVRQKFGATIVLSLVKGSRSARIVQYGLDQSAFYGSLSGLTMRQLQDILRFMIQDGLVETTADTYRVLRITPKGSRFFAHPSSLTMRQYKKGKEPDVQDDEVFEQLRAVRLRLSRKYRVPPYAIFTDRTLHEMAQQRPRTKGEMLAISGVGEVKYRKFGRYFTALFKDGE